MTAAHCVDGSSRCAKLRLDWSYYLNVLGNLSIAQSIVRRIMSRALTERKLRICEFFFSLISN